MSTPEDVTVTAILADAAQVVLDKLYLLGGGWTYAWPGEPDAPISMALGVLVHVPWSQTNRRLPVETRLVDEDGGQVTQEYGDVRAQGVVEAGRPPGSRHGAPIVVPFVVAYAVSLDYGGYVWEVEVDGQVRARVAFQVTTPPGMQPPMPGAEPTEEGT